MSWVSIVLEVKEHTKTHTMSGAGLADARHSTARRNKSSLMRGFPGANIVLDPEDEIRDRIVHEIDQTVQQVVRYLGVRCLVPCSWKRVGGDFSCPEEGKPADEIEVPFFRQVVLVGGPPAKSRNRVNVSFSGQCRVKIIAIEGGKIGGNAGPPRPAETGMSSVIRCWSSRSLTRMPHTREQSGVHSRLYTAEHGRSPWPGGARMSSSASRRR